MSLYHNFNTKTSYSTNYDSTFQEQSRNDKHKNLSNFLLCPNKSAPIGESPRHSELNTKVTKSFV